MPNKALMFAGATVAGWALTRALDRLIVPADDEPGDKPGTTRRRQGRRRGP